MILVYWCWVRICFEGQEGPIVVPLKVSDLYKGLLSVSSAPISEICGVTHSNFS